MSQMRKTLPVWLEPWRRVLVINLIFLATLALLGVAYFVFVQLCYYVIGNACAGFVGPAVGF
jgi:hypothetical protein